jgi:hypothetical protein
LGCTRATVRTRWERHQSLATRLPRMPVPV